VKLYVWTPEGHGQLSFCVMAESEEQARAAVDRQVLAVRHNRGDYAVDGWGTDYYTLGEYGVGKVVEHEND